MAEPVHSVLRTEVFSVPLGSWRKILNVLSNLRSLLLFIFKNSSLKNEVLQAQHYFVKTKNKYDSNNILKRYVQLCVITCSNHQKTGTVLNFQQLSKSADFYKNVNIRISPLHCSDQKKEGEILNQGKHSI